MDYTFCLIKDPFLQEEHYIIFITKKNCDKMDFSIRKEVKYKFLQKHLEKIGYIEVDDLRFEFSGTYKSKNPSYNDIIEHMDSIYVFYNKNLENNINQDFYIMDKVFNENKINIFFEENNKNTSIMKKIHNTNFNYTQKIPAIGEFVDISFYLIVDFFFREKTKDFKVDLNGSFLLERNSENKYRNLIKILTESFERFEPNDYLDFSNFETMHFRSVKSKGEILDEVSFLYELSIKLKKQKEETSIPYKLDYIFNIFDIKDVINLDERIVVSIDFFDYKNMLEISDTIKTGLDEGFEKNINIDEIIESTKTLKENLKKRMIKLGEKEEFDKAIVLQKNIKTIDKKIETYTKEVGKQYLDIQEFHHFFNLK